MNPVSSHSISVSSHFYSAVFFTSRYKITNLWLFGCLSILNEYLNECIWFKIICQRNHQCNQCSIFKFLRYKFMWERVEWFLKTNFQIILDSLVSVIMDYYCAIDCLSLLSLAHSILAVQAARSKHQLQLWDLWELHIQRTQSVPETFCSKFQAFSHHTRAQAAAVKDVIASKNSSPKNQLYAIIYSPSCHPSGACSPFFSWKLLE